MPRLQTTKRVKGLVSKISCLPEEKLNEVMVPVTETRDEFEEMKKQIDFEEMKEQIDDTKETLRVEFSGTGMSSPVWWIEARSPWNRKMKLEALNLEAQELKTELALCRHALWTVYDTFKQATLKVDKPRYTQGGHAKVEAQGVRGQPVH